ncbi:MAG TPA: VWA domain-containing protein [Thermoanaerobaculia bacterium]|nr:VWA domain-containing protein [Thermoanaerobaculia bacterium]
MTFRDFWMLWLVALVPIALAFLVARERHRARLARRFVAERLRDVTNALRALRPCLVGIALALALVALAGPRSGFRIVPLEEREANRVIAIDVSNSMLATDVGTSRLEAAKAIAKRIIEAHQGRVGLIAFEMSGDVVSPLTTDGDAVTALVDTLEAGEIGQPGTDFGGAIQTAMRLVGADPAQRGDVVLISDGEDLGTHLPDALRQAKARGVVVSTVLVGSGEGATIPTPSGEPLRDESGHPVTTYGRADVLEKIAAQTGGSFFANPFAEHALDSLAAARAAGAAKKKDVRVPIDGYQWPLALAFAALFCGSIVHRGAE